MSLNLFGLYIDDLLNFDAHIDNICRKAGRKLNVLARLSGVLNVEYKLVLFVLLFYHILNIVQPFSTFAVGIRWGKWKNYKESSSVCI